MNEAREKIIELYNMLECCNNLVDISTYTNVSYIYIYSVIIIIIVIIRRLIGIAGRLGHVLIDVNRYTHKIFFYAAYTNHSAM